MWITTCFCLLIFLPAIAISFHLSQFYLQEGGSSRDIQDDREILPSHSTSSSWLIPSPRDKSRHMTYPGGREETSFGGHTTVQATTSGSSLYPPDPMSPRGGGGVFPSEVVPSHWQNQKETPWTSVPDLSSQGMANRPTHQHMPSDSFYNNYPLMPEERMASPRAKLHVYHQEPSPRDPPTISQDQVFHFPDTGRPPPRPQHPKPVTAYQRPPHPGPSGYQTSGQRRRTRKKEESEPEWRGTNSDIVAAAQISAWKDAIQAGADFVTPEMVAAHVGKTPDWVKAAWNTDLRTLPRRPESATMGITTHGRKGLCGHGTGGS